MVVVFRSVMKLVWCMTFGYRKFKKLLKFLCNNCFSLTNLSVAVFSIVFVFGDVSWLGITSFCVCTVSLVPSSSPSQKKQKQTAGWILCLTPFSIPSGTRGYFLYMTSFFFFSVSIVDKLVCWRIIPQQLEGLSLCINNNVIFSNGMFWRRSAGRICSVLKLTSFLVFVCVFFFFWLSVTASRRFEAVSSSATILWRGK